MRSVFSKIKKEDFLEILNTINRDTKVNVDYLYQQYIDGNSALIDLQNSWYEKLIDGIPDYSVYSEDIYINEAFICWKMYSRRYLMLLDKWLNTDDCPIMRSNEYNILDLGCGLAYTTLGIKEIFPNSKVHGTNEPDSLQIKFDKLVTREVEDIYIHDSNFNIADSMDIIFAFEFFEHIISPIEFLERLVSNYSPKYIIFANTFTRPAIGHFNKYKCGNIYVDGKSVSRLFIKKLNNLGYIKVKTGFFNNRPSIYKLDTNVKKGCLFDASI